MDRLSELYRRIVEDENLIPEAMQARIAQTFITKKDFDTLGMLAARAETTGEADRLIATRHEPQVVAGWARRAGRSREEIAKRFADEKRVSVILPLARTRNLPQEVYLHLGRPDSRKIADALLKNSSVPAACKLERIDLIMEALESERDGRQMGNVYLAINDEPEVARAILRRARRLGTALPALRALGDPDTETLDILLSRLETMLDGEALLGALIDLLETLAVLDLDERQLAILRRVVTKQARIHTETARSYWGPNFTDVKKMVSTKGRETLESIRSLGTCEDPGTATRILKELAEGRRGETTLGTLAVNTACKNPVIPVQVMVKYLEHADTEPTLCLLQNWLKAGEYDAMLELAEQGYGEPWWLPEIENPLPLLLHAIEVAKMSGRWIPSWVTEHPLVSGSPEIALETLPWHYIAQLDDTTVDTNLVLRVAASFINEKLGDDQTRWDTFAGLAEDFSGTLPELVEAALTV